MPDTPPPPRAYLVVLDGTPEARAALRFAARRAAKTGGTVELLAVVPPTEFVQWGGVQDAIEEELRLGAEALLHQAAGETLDELGVRPSLTVREGEPARAIRDYLRETPDIAALVLGAPPAGPGPLVEEFAANVGAMPCPLMIVPAALDDAALDRLS